MKFEWNVLCVSEEVGVGRKKFEASSDRHCTDEQVRSRALEALLTQTIVVSRGGFIVLFVEVEIRVESQILLELLEPFVRLSPGEQFLAYGAK